MDPERHSPTPPAGANPPAYASHPSEGDRRSALPGAATGPQPPPSLPSIHQLPLNLPSTSAGVHRLQMPPPHGYAPGYETSAGYTNVAPVRHADDSDHEGGDGGPPKKKRRRQALSCTECKRRKIKCDRAQPCGPCTRRGEQNKCQWHIIEPMEKYVTRAEYDDLKARFDNLEASVARILPSFSAAPLRPSTVSPTMPIASTSAPESSQAAGMPPYRIQGPATSPGYRITSPQSSVRGDLPFPASSSMGPRSPPVPYRIAPPPFPQARAPRTMPSPPSAPRVPSPGPPLSSSSRLPDTRLPTSRRASLSLAAITLPHTPGEGASYAAAQPKNHRAQTQPLLGQRLRQASALPGPAAEHRRRARRSSSSRCCTAFRPATATKWRLCRRGPRPPLRLHVQDHLPTGTRQKRGHRAPHSLLGHPILVSLGRRTATLVTSSHNDVSVQDWV